MTEAPSELMSVFFAGSGLESLKIVWLQSNLCPLPGFRVTAQRLQREFSLQLQVQQLTCSMLNAVTLAFTVTLGATVPSLVATEHQGSQHHPTRFNNV